jgi:hypothetical protein
MMRKSARKREFIEPHTGDKRYIRRDAKGRINKEVDVGRSLAADRRSHSKTVAKPGQGDRGDRATAKRTVAKKKSAGMGARR